MFSALQLLGTPESAIELRTRANHPVVNAQAPPQPSPHALARYERVAKRYPLWERPRAAVGWYNCFGLVWASRRTAIYEEDGVQRILRDDGYRRLRDPEQPAVGDLAAYYADAECLSTLHVGVVVELRQLVGGKMRMPIVLSKWDDSSGEDIHRARDVPWVEFTLAYWTERP